MRTEIIVSKWTRSAVTIGSDVLCVVRQTDANRDASAIVSRTDVPSMRRVADETRVIRTPGNSAGAGCGIPVICGKAKSLQHSRHKRQVLEVRRFKTVDPSTAGVEWLSDPAGDRRGTGCIAEGAARNGNLVRN